MNVVKIDVEEYLNEIKCIEVEIENKRAEIKYLRDLSLSLGGAPLGCDVSKTSKPTDRIGRVLDRIIDEENELADEVDKCLDFRKEARKNIDQLPNSLHRDILYKHHFQNVSLRRISRKTGYAYSTILEYHGEAKEALQEILTTKIVKQPT